MTKMMTIMMMIIMVFSMLMTMAVLPSYKTQWSGISTRAVCVNLFNHG